MTDLAKLSDQEVNRRVAEAMGWTRHAYKDADPKEVFCLSGGEWYWQVPGETGGRCERCEADAPPDFLHDWEAFGRLWEWLLEKDIRPTSFDPTHEFDMGRNPRRALALAYLEAVNQ